MKIFYCLLTILLTLQVYAADESILARKISEGNKSYKSGNFEEAEQKYADAQVDAPDDQIVNYNAGLACYRLQKYEEAIAAFQRSASYAGSLLEAKCHYNIGNCLFRQGKLKEALESYKKANELDRDDEDTKLNIEYLTRLMKEMASQQKDEQEKDPLQKLLRELEALIRAQNITLVKTVKGSAATNLPPLFTEGLVTNQNAHSAKADFLITGFQALFTNLPPERLNAPLGGPRQEGLEKTPENEALLDLSKNFATLSQGMNQCFAGGSPQLDVFQSLSNSVAEARSAAVGMVSQNISPYINDLAGRSAEVFNNFYDFTQDISLLDAPALKECADKFQALANEIVDALNTRSGKKAQAEESGENISSNVTAAATLAMKITNAVEYLKIGSKASKTGAEALRRALAEAPTNQFVALDNFIKARKEFEEDNQDNNEKQDQNQQQQQNQNQNQDQDQDQQDQKDQQDQQDQQDQKDQQDQQDQQNQQNQDQSGQQDQDQNQNQNQDQQPQGQDDQEMSKDQAEQLLRSFEEDNSNNEKNRRKGSGGIVPVDKNW